MYLSELTLKNWRSHHDTKIKFGAVTLIRGGNNSGKSSIAQAIEYVLTGRCPTTDEAGRGAEEAISVGARDTCLTAQLLHGNPVDKPSTGNGVVLERCRNLSGGSVSMKVEGRTHAGRQVAELLEKWGYAVDVMSAALRSGRFVSLDDKEQKELLADVLKPERMEVPEEIREMLASQSMVAFPALDLDEVRDLEQTAINMRAECTAALRELGEPEEEDIPETPSVDQIRGKLADLIAEQMKLVSQKQKVLDAWGERNQRRRRLPEQIATLESSVLPAEAEKHLLGVIADEAKIRKAGPELARVNTEIMEKRRQLETIVANSEKCPTCGQAFDTDAIKARLEDAIKAATSRVPTLEGLHGKYQDLETASQKLKAHRAAVLDLPKLREEAESLGPLEEIPETVKLDKQVEELSERVKKGQGKLAEVAAIEERRKARSVRLERRRNLEIRRGTADALAKWAGPNGIQAQMVGGKLEGFTKTLNSVLERFGYACEFELEPYAISVRHLGADKSLPLGALSESEQWRFGMALQSALASVTGFGILVLDRADVLSTNNRATLIKTALQLNLQVIVCATAELTPIEIPGLKVFDLTTEAGRTVVTERG